MEEKKDDFYIKNIEKSYLSIQAEIKNYDTKSGILIGAIGFLFGLSTMLNDVIINAQPSAIKTSIIIIFSFYILIFLLAFLFLMLTIWPRDKNKKENNELNDSCLYSKDLYKNRNNKIFDSFVKNGPTIDTLLNQIKICSRICVIKKKTFIFSLIFTIIFCVLLCIILSLSIFL